MYEIPAYDRPDTFYLDSKTLMNMYIRSFENPYFGDEKLKKKLLSEFDLTYENFNYIISNISSERIAGTWNYRVFFNMKTEPNQKDKILFQRYLYMINELTKIKIHRSYKSIRTNLYQIALANIDVKMVEQDVAFLNKKIEIAKHPHLGPLMKEAMLYVEMLNSKPIKSFDEMFPKKEEAVVYDIYNISDIKVQKNYFSDQVIYFLSLLTFVSVYYVLLLSRR